MDDNVYDDEENTAVIVYMVLTLNVPVVHEINLILKKFMLNFVDVLLEI